MVICYSQHDGVIAFCSFAPDIEMLKIVGTGVAMGNAIPEVKEIADVVTMSNDDDGIAKYLEDMINEI